MRRLLVLGMGGLAAGAPGWAWGLMSARDGAVEVVTRVRRSIVAVGFHQPTASPRFQFRGSGWIAGDGRWVVTNAHVIARSGADAPAGEQLMVMVMPVQADRARAAGEPRAARLVATVPEADLALLRIDGPPLPALDLAPGSAVEGQDILLLGFPLGGALGLTPVVHRGIISSVAAIALPAVNTQAMTARNLARLRAGAFDIYQLDAKAYPGNSGGPVVDASTGQVLGVINMVMVKGTRESALADPTGISYAIPVAHVREMLAQARAE